MQNQESMFEKPESTPAQPINSYPREQQQQQRQEIPPVEENEAANSFKEYSEGYGSEERQEGYIAPYAEHWQMEGEKIRPRKQRPGRNRIRARPLIIALLIIALVIGWGGIASGRFVGTNSSLPAQTFVVTSTPKLVVNATNGNVRIHAGNSENVVVSARERGFDFSNENNVPVKTEQSGNTIDVSTSGNYGSFPGSGRVDLDITVPATSSLEIHTTSGGINLEGVNGEVTLATNSGDIKGINLNGTFTVNTGSGDVELRQTVLQGQSSFVTSSGDVDIQGGLDPQGNYQFQTGSGNVDLKLPDDAAFHLDASSSSGEIDNGFEHRPTGSNTPSSPSIKINTGSGDISIQPQDD